MIEFNLYVTTKGKLVMVTKNNYYLEVSGLDQYGFITKLITTQ